MLDNNTLLTLDRPFTLSELAELLQEILERRPDLAENIVSVSTNPSRMTEARRFWLAEAYAGDEDGRRFIVLSGIEDEAP